MKVHLVKTRLVNSYVVEQHSDCEATQCDLLVVDVAVGCERYVLGFIEQALGLDISRVKLVCCTHDDPDHMGGVIELAQLCAAEVALPFAAGSRLKKLKNNIFGMFIRLRTGLREAMRPRAWKMYLSRERNREASKQARYDGPGVAPNGTKIEAEHHRLKAGDTLPGFSDWQVIHTPGHSWDSVCYYHANSEALLSGDTLLGSGSLERLVTPAIYSNADHTEETLQHLSTLKISTVYPGHGSIMQGDNVIHKTRIQ